MTRLARISTLAAIIAVAAITQSYAAPKTVTVVWDGQEVQVAVDGEYSGTPEDQTLQQVIAGDVRPAVRTLEQQMATVNKAINDLRTAQGLPPLALPEGAEGSSSPSVPVPPAEPESPQGEEGKAATPTPAPAASGGLTEKQAKAIADQAVADALKTLDLEPNKKLVDQLTERLAAQAEIVTVKGLKDMTKAVNAANRKSNWALGTAIGAGLVALIALVLAIWALLHSRGTRRGVARVACGARYYGQDPEQPLAPEFSRELYGRYAAPAPAEDEGAPPAEPPAEPEDPDFVPPAEPEDPDFRVPPSAEPPADPDPDAV